MPDAALKHITKPQTPFKMLLHWMQPWKKKLQTLYVLHVTYFDTPAVDLIRVIVGHTSPLHKTQVLYIYRVNKNVVVSWYEVITLEMMIMATTEGLSQSLPGKIPRHHSCAYFTPSYTPFHFTACSELRCLIHTLCAKRPTLLFLSPTAATTGSAAREA